MAMDSTKMKCDDSDAFVYPGAPEVVTVLIKTAMVPIWLSQ